MRKNKRLKEIRARLRNSYHITEEAMTIKYLLNKISRLQAKLKWLDD